MLLHLSQVTNWLHSTFSNVVQCCLIRSRLYFYLTKVQWVFGFSFSPLNLGHEAGSKQGWPDTRTQAWLWCWGAGGLPCSGGSLGKRSDLIPLSRGGSKAWAMGRVFGCFESISLGLTMIVDLHFNCHARFRAILAFYFVSLASVASPIKQRLVTGFPTLLMKLSNSEMWDLKHFLTFSRLWEF